MTRLRRIVLSGLDNSEKLRIVGKCARLLIEYGKRDPQVRELAVRIVSHCRNKDSLCEVKSLHAYVRDNVRYIKDIANVERFATPQRTLFIEKSGDCDDSSIALSALLESIGHETRLVLVDPQTPGQLSHVAAQVLLNDGWHWMETTRKVPFDWKPPFTVSYVVDEDSAGEDVMNDLNDLFDADGELNIGDIGYLGRGGRGGGGGSRGGGSRGGGSRSSSSRSSPSRSSPSRSFSRAVSAARSVAARVTSRATKAVTGAARAKVSAIAQRAQQARQTLVKKAVGVKKQIDSRFQQRAAQLKNKALQTKNRIDAAAKQKKISEAKAKEMNRLLRQRAEETARKLQAEKAQQQTMLLAEEAKKEQQITESQVELEKEVVESAPPSEVVREEREPEPEREEEPEPEAEEEEPESEPEDEDETGEDADTETENGEDIEEIDGLGRIRRKKPKTKPRKTAFKAPAYGETPAQKRERWKKRGSLLTAKQRIKKDKAARAKGDCAAWDLGCQAQKGADSLKKGAMIIGGLAIVAWIAKDVIIAKIKK